MFLFPIWNCVRWIQIKWILLRKKQKQTKKKTQNILNEFQMDGNEFGIHGSKRLYSLILFILFILGKTWKLNKTKYEWICVECNNERHLAFNKAPIKKSHLVCYCVCNKSIWRNKRTSQIIIIIIIGDNSWYQLETVSVYLIMKLDAFYF